MYVWLCVCVCVCVCVHTHRDATVATRRGPRCADWMYEEAWTNRGEGLVLRGSPRYWYVLLVCATGMWGSEVALATGMCYWYVFPLYVCFVHIHTYVFICTQSMLCYVCNMYVMCMYVIRTHKHTHTHAHTRTRIHTHTTHTWMYICRGDKGRAVGAGERVLESSSRYHARDRPNRFYITKVDKLKKFSLTN